MLYLIDTCVLVSALRSKSGASNKLLELVLQRLVPVVVHYKLALEYEAVLTREVQRKAIALDSSSVLDFISSIVAVAQITSVRFLIRPNLPDEADNFVYEIAVASSPCTIITFNIRDFQDAEQHWPGVFVATPQSVVTMVERQL